MNLSKSPFCTSPHFGMQCERLTTEFESTNSVARTQKSYFDKHAKGPKCALDQHVWLYWPRPLVRQRNKKLTQIWTGPWKIQQFITPLVVPIKPTKNNKIQTVHIDRLAPCYLPPPPSTTEQQTSLQKPLMKEPVEIKRRSTRSRKPPLYLTSYIQNPCTRQMLSVHNFI